MSRRIAAGTLAMTLTIALALPGASAVAPAGAYAAAAASATLTGVPSWPGADMARGVALLGDGSGGYVLDAWGGLTPFAVGSAARPPAVTGATVWPWRDAARGVALLPDGSGGYVVDGRGRLWPFAVGSRPKPPAVTGNDTWGWDIARGVTLLPSGTGGYVVDGWGGLHPFAVGANPVPARPSFGPYWTGWDIVRGVNATTETGGYVIDGWGGLHPFAVGGGTPPPPQSADPYWPGKDVARGLARLSDGTPVVVDRTGALWTPGSGGGAAFPDRPTPPPAPPAPPSPPPSSAPPASAPPASTPPAASSSGPPATGPHAFLGINAAGVPARYNPCAPLEYVTNLAGAPPSARADVQSAIAAISSATGLTFRFAGDTNEPARPSRPLYQPDRYGDRWAPILIAWTDPAQVPSLADRVVGLGGSAWYDAPSGPTYVSGFAYIDRTDRLDPGSSGSRPTVELVTHELGHVVGLAHVNDPVELMYPTMRGRVGFGPGDLEGFWDVGAAQGCLPVPPTAWAQASGAGSQVPAAESVPAVHSGEDTV